jgi:hypothetical protein
MTLFYNWKNDLNIRPLTLSLIPAVGSYIEPPASDSWDMPPLLRVAGVSHREEQLDLICEAVPEACGSAAFLAFGGFQHLLDLGKPVALAPHQRDALQDSVAGCLRLWRSGEGNGHFQNFRVDAGELFSHPVEAVARLRGICKAIWDSRNP